MSEQGVQFDLGKVAQPRARIKTSKLVSCVMNYSGGLVKNETQANYALFVFVFVAVLISYIVFPAGGTTKAKMIAPAGYHVVYPESAPPRLEKI